MITVDDKIDVFTKIVLDRLEEAYSEKISELDAETYEAVREYEAKLKVKSRKFIEVNEENARSDVRKKLSKVVSGIRTQRLRLKHEIVLELCEALRERVQAFRKSEDYLEFLIQRIEQAAPELKAFDRIDVELLEEDLARYRDTLDPIFEGLDFEAARLNWRPVRKGLLGGLVFYDGGRTLKLDGSFDVLLENAEVVVGQLVAELLEGGQAAGPSAAGTQHGIERGESHDGA